MKRLSVDAAQCSGCRFCEMVCSYRHEGVFSPTLSRVSVVKEDSFGMDYPVFCRLCDPCPSIDACPSDALGKTGDGTILCDHEACTGCEACAGACPYDAIKMDGSSRPLICDLCSGEPACAQKCPTKALTFGEADFRPEHPEEVFQDLKRRWGIHG
jgi:carbon-monoxide dehydrogenase iron sulfur subunit